MKTEMKGRVSDVTKEETGGVRLTKKKRCGEAKKSKEK